MENTKRIQRYIGGFFTLFILAFLIYEWFKGMEIETNEVIGLCVAFFIFLSSYSSRRRKTNK